MHLWKTLWLRGLQSPRYTHYTSNILQRGDASVKAKQTKAENKLSISSNSMKDQRKLKIRVTQEGVHMELSHDNTRELGI